MPADQLPRPISYLPSHNGTRAKRGDASLYETCPGRQCNESHRGC